MLLAKCRSCCLFRRGDWRASKGFDCCSVPQHHLSCLSEGMQFLAAKHTHSSLSFTFSLYFSKLIIKIFLFSFKYSKNQVSVGVTSESFCLPKKQTCQTPAPGGSFRGPLSECWVGCLPRLLHKVASSGLVVAFQDSPETHKVGTLHLETSTIFKPFEAAVQSEGAELPCCTPCCNMGLCCGFRYIQGFFQSVLVEMQCQIDWTCSVLILIWAKTLWASLGLHGKIYSLLLQMRIIWGFSRDSSCYLSLKKAFLSCNVNE